MASAHTPLGANVLARLELQHELHALIEGFSMVASQEDLLRAVQLLELAEEARNFRHPPPGCIRFAAARLLFQLRDGVRPTRW